MTVLMMPKKTGSKKIDPPSGGRVISSLKVRKEDADLVGLIATHRGLSVEKFFMERDVREFFRELLKIELKKTGDRLGN